MDAFTVPPALEPGDEVAVVAPASGSAAAFPHVYELGLERIREVFGLEPVEFPTARKDSEYLYAHPEERARDVMDAFEDPRIEGVIATIGGNDQIRMLKHLDPDVLRDNPTRFFGTSDNTNLGNYLWNLGVVSFYGGNLMTEFAMQGTMCDYTVEYLERALFDDEIGAIEPAEEFTDHDLDWADPDALDRRREFEPNPGWTWRGADRRAEGRAWGGCLEVVDLILASDRYLPPLSALDGAVLFLETSEDMPGAEEVRRMVMGMGERGLLERLNGVVVGRAKARTPFDDPGPEEREQFRADQREVIQKTVTEYNPDIPIVFDVDFGHTNPVVPIPIGSTVELDPENERIAFQ